MAACVRAAAPSAVLNSSHLEYGKGGSWESAGRDLQRTVVEKDKRAPFVQGSPVFLRQHGNESEYTALIIMALAPLRERWLLFREEQLGLHNGLQLSRII